MSQHKSNDSSPVQDRRTYIAWGALILGPLFLGTVIFLIPKAVSAFWPFSTSVRAATDGADVPIIHDPSQLTLLEAAINPDPDPSKGEGDIPTTGGSALIANAGPDGSFSGDTQDIPSGPANISSYVVKDGDSLSGIASSFGVSVNTILWANDLTIKSTIKPGMTLVILPVSGLEHTVRSGETLASIAKKYSADVNEIATYNGLGADAALTSGSDIIIPGGELPTTTAAPKKTTSSSSKSSATRSDLSAPSAGSGYYEDPVPGAILTQGIHGKNGVDLGAPSGTPIHAAAEGTVIISKGNGAWNGGYGSYVVVSHANGTQTLYSHMSKDVATVGETVSQGDILGYVGETGEATGNHLHFEVRGAKNPFGYECTLMKKCY